ncbi:hypothetical protein [Sneathiella glossodoripedis]|uniref:hypothetical protein n=1 Tax=Sneathiella glossodoripedis TaxID=418853 RepID=UPI0004702719|nr:hypothetical protein [Sneathiella glossodoripedis]
MKKLMKFTLSKQLWARLYSHAGTTALVLIVLASGVRVDASEFSDTGYVSLHPTALYEWTSVSR